VLCCVPLTHSIASVTITFWHMMPYTCVCSVLVCIRCNQELIAEAVLPTLRALFDAPSTSPLAEVKVANVADLLIELTDVRHPMASKQTSSASLVVKVESNLVALRMWILLLLWLCQWLLVAVWKLTRTPQHTAKKKKELAFRRSDDTVVELALGTRVNSADSK